MYNISSSCSVSYAPHTPALGCSKYFSFNMILCREEEAREGEYQSGFSISITWSCSVIIDPFHCSKIQNGAKD